MIEGTPYDIRYAAREFNGWTQLHWTAPFVGERYSLVWFTPEAKVSQGRKEPGLRDDERAELLAREHSRSVPFLPALAFRPHSTDALVIKELLDARKGSAYTLRPNEIFPEGFSLKNHTTVLDIGAHIGVFSRFAIAEGCQHVISYEPEPTNFALLSQNLGTSHSDSLSFKLVASAVAYEASALQVLVRARNENDGKQNTWRHSLENYSMYVDRTSKLPSRNQAKTLERFPVKTVSFFGGKQQEGALVPGVSFLKLDCEGAEMDILLSQEAARRSSWLDTTHLVAEWSFTKERRVSVFHKAMKNLRKAGFEIYYEGIGSWWDVDDSVMWPYPSDLVVFAMMKLANDGR